MIAGCSGTDRPSAPLLALLGVFLRKAGILAPLELLVVLLAAGTLGLLAFFFDVAAQRGLVRVVGDGQSDVPAVVDADVRFFVYQTTRILDRLR